jgi:hypothetical protein
MQKLKLELDALHVQSFETARRPVAWGTVRGHGADLYGGDTDLVVGAEPIVGPKITDGSCGAPDCKTEPAICPP